jgi:hypothetical protein
MPYTLKLENNVLRFTLSGRVTGSDFMSAATEVTVYEKDVSVVPHRITDLDGAELAIGYPEISALAAKRRQLRFPNPLKSAIIARNPQHLGYARMNARIGYEIFLPLRRF